VQVLEDTYLNLSDFESINCLYFLKQNCMTPKQEFSNFFVASDGRTFLESVKCYSFEISAVLQRSAISLHR
jgi:hypothetical protein